MQSPLARVLETLLRQPGSLLWEVNVECVDAFWLGCGGVFSDVGAIVSLAEDTRCPRAARFRSLFDEARFHRDCELASTAWLLDGLYDAALDGAFDDPLVEFSAPGIESKILGEAGREPVHPALLYWAWDRSPELRIRLARKIEVLGALHRGYVWALESVGVPCRASRFELEQFGRVLACSSDVGDVRFWEQIAKMRNLQSSHDRMTSVLAIYWWWLNQLYSVRLADAPPDPVIARNHRIQELVHEQRTAVRKLPDYSTCRRRLLELPNIIDEAR